jgi:predicted small metal-binding protein
MKEFSCGAVVPGCDAHFSGDSVDEILGQVGPHAAEAHGITDVTPELIEQVTAKIKDVPAT